MTTAAMSHCAMVASLRFRCGKDGAIDARIAARRGLRGESGKCDHPSRAPEIGSAIVAVQQRVERGRERADVTWRNEEACTLVLDRIGQATGLECDDGCLAELRFDRHEPEPFVGRRNHDCRRASVQLDETWLREMSDPMHAVRNAE